MTAGEAISAFARWWLDLDHVRSLYAGGLILGLIVPALLSLWDWRRY